MSQNLACAPTIFLVGRLYLPVEYTSEYIGIFYYGAESISLELRPFIIALSGQ